MTGQRWLLLPVETKAREFHAKLLLAAVAAQQGWQVLLGEQNAMVRQLPHLPRGVYIDKSIARTKTKHFRRLRARGHRIVAWCEEGFVYRNTESYLHERIDLDSLAEVDAFFCWGQVQRDAILSKAVGQDAKLIETGNPRFDLLRRGYRDLFRADADRLRRDYGPFILVNTNFARYNHFNGENFLIDVQKQRGAIKTAEQEQFFIDWRDFLGQLFHAFADVMPELARAFPNHRIVLRPHPSENHRRWAEVCAGLDGVDVIYKGSALPWLLASEVLIHNSCTTGLEAYLMDRPVLAYQPVTSNTYDSILPNAISRVVATPQDLVEGVRDALGGGTVDGGAEGRRLAEHYYASLDGDLAAQRVIAVLNDLAVQEDAAGHFPQRLASYLSEPLQRLARRLLRPQMYAYAQQKFPGISLGEVRAVLDELTAASGQFGGLRVSGFSHHCYRIAAS